MTVFINTSRFSADPQYSNSAGVLDRLTEKLLEWNLKGLEHIYRAGYRYKKAGVLLNRLAPVEQLPMRLSGDERFKRSQQVMNTVDELNAKYGRDTVRFGTALPGGRWETKFLRRSRRYTTCLNEVLSVA